VSSLPFDESTTFTPPSAFGPYRVLHQIGSGVLGPVFRTYDPQSDRLVAVKAFRLDLLPEDVARLADGLRRLVGTAGHLAAGLEGMTAYLAMDYYAAETLDVALRHLAPAPMETALPLLRGMAEAIDRAWSVGPLNGHGSLHPRDVFITPGTTEVSVTGCGVAPALEAIGARAPVRRPYTAPERAAGGSWDVRADVYSLGAIAHELLTGRRPAGPGEQDGTLPSTMAPELRVRVRRVLSKALSEAPTQRFASCEEFVAALADPSALPEFEPVAPVVVDVIAAMPMTPALFDVVSEPVVRESESASAAPTPPRRRARVASPASRAPVASTLVVAPVVSAADVPLRQIDDPPLRIDPPLRPSVPPASLPLPSQFPWVAVATVLVAGLVLGAVGMRTYDNKYLSVGSGATPSLTPIASAPTPIVGAVPSSPAPGDTEVAVAPPPAAPSASNSRPSNKSAPPGKTDRAAAPARSATTGSLNVDSRPKGARVTIDGHVIGVTPTSAPGLKIGVHAVRVELAGYKTVTTNVTVKAGETAKLAVTLERR